MIFFGYLQVALLLSGEIRMHVHISMLDFLKVALYLIIFGFFWHLVSYQNADKEWGKAMTFIF